VALTISRNQMHIREIKGDRAVAGANGPRLRR
jgi:hypothetical protein